MVHNKLRFTFCWEDTVQAVIFLLDKKLNELEEGTILIFIFIWYYSMLILAYMRGYVQYDNLQQKRERSIDHQDDFQNNIPCS